MNDMQWALLVIGVVAVFGVYFHARRQAAKQAVWNNKKKRDGQEEDQLDFFEDNGASFDEYGVGKARNTSEARQAPVLDQGADRDEHLGSAVRDEFEGLFVISVHRNDLSHVAGEDLHEALESCGLQFGAHDVYHRFSPKGDRVFSITSMVKPGFLIPEDKDDLHTPGVSLFLQLPGAVDGESAFEDLFTTAQTLADRMDASLLDRQRQPLTTDMISRMREASARYE
ncbi:MAG: cell division protein ZipA C-terminal FtsZ-binding domain-containing protein [Oceanococcus sp.]